MSTTGKNSFRRAHDEELSRGNQESTRPVVVAFPNRVSDKAVGDTLRESVDFVDEVEQPAAVHPRDSAGGEVLLW